MPVSYTHLDVYKRQTEGSGQRWVETGRSGGQGSPWAVVLESSSIIQNTYARNNEFAPIHGHTVTLRLGLR